MLFNQSDFEVRCEWGIQGVLQLAPISDAIIIVDVFSFSTCVEIATARGATVFPYNGKREELEDFAKAREAQVAGFGLGVSGYSLSPHSLLTIPNGYRLVLPSLNGSTLSLATGETPTFAGCLRNYQAVAQAAQRYGKCISVIPAGERWRDDGSLRPAYEDWIGAGAILSELSGNLSPESRAARAAFLDAQSELDQILRSCASAKEHIEAGLEQNVGLVGAANISGCVPFLHEGAYQDQKS
ncbi:MAG: 2-phosphosulfolactate phosphatase [Caldilineaceae bacterium]